MCLLHLHFVTSSICTYFNIGVTILANVFNLQIYESDAYKRIHFNSDAP